MPERLAVRIEPAAGTTPVSAWLTQRIEAHLEAIELERRWREFYPISA